MTQFSQMFWLKLVGLLAVSHQALCQSGYNYGQSELALGGTAALANQIRPVVGSTASALPTAPTAFGGTTANINPTTAYGAFVGQPARPILPTAAGFAPTTAAAAVQQTQTSGYAAANTAAGSLAQRTQARPLRPAQGIYAANANIPQSNQPQFAGSTRIGQPTALAGNLNNDYDGDYSAIPGVPGVDYPIYSQVPQTSFDCEQQPLPGYYSDIEAQCQVFHICALNRTYSFLCPNGTIFSQEVLVCVWWNQYECATAPSLYGNNAYIYDYGERTSAGNAGYQNVNTNQIGLAAGTQARSLLNNIGGAVNAGRAAAPAAGGIYNAANIRGTNPQIPIQTAGFTGIDSFATTAGNAGNVATTNIGQTFPRTNPIGATAQTGVQGFGAALRSNTRPTGTAGGIGATLGYNSIPEKAQATGNREYLPPRRP